MKIYLGSDHAGYQLKARLVEVLKGEGHDVEDLGNHEEDPNDDYPDFIFPVAHAVAANPGSRGIVLGGSGQGEAIAANRIKGVRAAVFYGGPDAIVHLSREHNDTNVLSLGARFIDDSTAKDMVHLWLSTPFSAEARHMQRIKKLDR
jgi:ribose 5-phosphate isomerase B